MGERAALSGVVVVVGSACVTGRSNAVAGGRLAQAVKSAAAAHTSKQCLPMRVAIRTAVLANGVVLGGR